MHRAAVCLAGTSAATVANETLAPSDAGSDAVASLSGSLVSVPTESLVPMLGPEQRSGSAEAGNDTLTEAGSKDGLWRTNFSRDSSGSG